MAGLANYSICGMKFLIFNFHSFCSYYGLMILHIVVVSLKWTIVWLYFCLAQLGAGVAGLS